MKSTNTLALSALFLNSFVAALPSRNHAHHAHQHNKRKLVYVTEEVVETVYSTTTIWVEPTPSVSVADVSSSVGGLFYEHHSHESPSSSPPPAPYTPSVAPVASSPSVYVAPPSSAYVAPSSVYTPLPAPSSVYTPPPAPSSVYTPPPAPSSVYTPPPAPSSVYVAPSSVAPPPPASSTPSSTTYSGQTYSGDVTYYNPAGGYGACGWTIQDSDLQVALAHGMMGEQSNGNPWCGKKIAISHNGQEYEATIGDKCGGCDGESIDLTQGLWDSGFTDIDGRGHNIEWRVID